MPQLYENTRYNFERNARKTITIYTAGGSPVTQTYNLHEPITIDTLSDVYIDSFISNDGTNTVITPVFLLGVDEFNIRSVAGATTDTLASKYNNKIIIPNTTGTASGATTIAHRATKFNYVGTINPCKLTKLTMSLTKDDGLGAIGGGKYWITFVIVSKE